MAPKKPSPDDILEHAKQLVDAAKDRDDLYDRIDDLYDQVKDVPATEEENVVIVKMPYATDAVDLVTDLAAQMELTIEVPAAKETVSAKKDADDIEEWLLAWWSLNERKQQQNLLQEAAWYGTQRSLVVARTLLIDANLDKDQEHIGSKLPVIVQLRDPRFCYPEEGAEGLTCMVEGWHRKAREIRRMHPGALADKERYPDDLEVEWIEYWDDKWVCYLADGEAVRVKGLAVRPHGYGVIPYSLGVGRSTPRKRAGKRYRPLLAAVEDTIRSLDIWYSILTTAGHDAMVNAWAVFSDTYGGQAAKYVDLSADAINYFSSADKLEAIQRPPLPTDFFQLGTLLTAAFQQATFPLALYGQIPGQMAGYAINMLNQAGRRPMVPIWSAVERAIEGAFGNALQIVKRKVAPVMGEKVSLVIRGTSGKDEMAGRAYRRAISLDVGNIGDDFDCIVSLSDPMPADEAQNLRMALEAWAGGKGLLSQETALSKFKIVSDALSEMERQQVEAIYRQLAPYEAIKLATERGYLPPDIRLPEGWTMQNGVPMPNALLEQPQQPAQPNPAELQQVAGMPEAMPEIDEMAGEPPPVPMIGGY